MVFSLWFLVYGFLDFGLWILWVMFFYGLWFIFSGFIGIGCF